MTILKDSKGKPLEKGALYCCFADDRDEDLVRFLGLENGRPRFADADTWGEVYPDFDYLVKQYAPVIDPADHGYNYK